MAGSDRAPAAAASGGRAPGADALAPGARPPLALHLVWRSAEPGADALARAVTRAFARDPERPLERGLGLPVRVWRDPTAADVDRLPLDEAAHAAVVPLVGDEMVLDGEAALAALRARVERSGGRHLLCPVALTGAAFRGALAPYNLVRLDEEGPASAADRLTDALAHALYRLLRGSGDAEGAPLRLFLSHATADGYEIARALHDHVHARTQLGTFFGPNSIAHGVRFGEAIERDAATSALVAVQTDAYAGREWCRREVLAAKAAGCAAVVVNAVRGGEARAFPYLGNVPTLRWEAGGAADAQCGRVVGAALREALRVLHFRHEVAAGGLIAGGAHAAAYPPELCTVAMLRRDERARRVAAPARRVVYADPPLADEEAALIRVGEPDLELVTPRLARRVDLAGRVVAISASESPDMAARGWAAEQLDDAVVELARYVFASGGSVAYGGDLREGGITESLLALAAAHDAAGTADRVHVHLAWPEHVAALDRAREAALRPAVRFHRAPRPDGVPAGATAAQVRADAGLMQRCLSVMRRRATGAAHARVFLGGRLGGYAGRWPGLLEEFAMAVGAGQPVYLVGAFGGATGALIQALEGELAGGALEAEAEQLVGGLRGLGSAALRNGLSDAENRELFGTGVTTRAIGLVLLGLGRALGPAPSAAHGTRRAHGGERPRADAGAAGTP